MLSFNAMPCICCVLALLIVTGCSDGQSVVDSPGNMDANDNDTTDSTDIDSDGSSTSAPPTNDNNNSGDNLAEAPDQSEPLVEADYPASRDEMKLTWDAALVSIPDNAGAAIASDTAALQTGVIGNDQLYPVVIYLHGCSGFWTGAQFRVNWFAEHGFVAVAPDSFARSFYPESCNLSTREGWQYEPTIAMRQFDLAYAIEQLRQFDWVDQQNVFVYGFSEGGVVAATFSSESGQHRLTARIAESWNCYTIPWQRYSGIAVPESEPVLAMMADQDPWLQGSQLPGSCADFISTTNGSQALLIDYEPLRNLHPLFEAAEIQTIVLDFLLAQSSLTP